MVKTTAKSIDEYLESLPADRREAVQAVRKVILKNIPRGYQESFNRGMLSYELPLSRYPKNYNNQPLAYAALASQKNYMFLYLMNVYGDKDTEEGSTHGTPPAAKGWTWASPAGASRSWMTCRLTSSARLLPARPWTSTFASMSRRAKSRPYYPQVAICWRFAL